MAERGREEADDADEEGARVSCDARHDRDHLAGRRDQEHDDAAQRSRTQSHRPSRGDRPGRQSAVLAVLVVGLLPAEDELLVPMPETQKDSLKAADHRVHLEDEADDEHEAEDPLHDLDVQRVLREVEVELVLDVVAVRLEKYIYIYMSREREIYIDK